MTLPEVITIPVHILRYRNRYLLVMQSIECIEIAKRGDPEVAYMEKIGRPYVRSGEFVDMAEK